MDWLMLLEQYGIPLVVATAFWFFIQKQNKFIQDELQKELRESFGRVEMIIVKLIDQQKKMQLEQKGIENSYKTLVEVIASLSGNGLKDKFMRMQERNENQKYQYKEVDFDIMGFRQIGGIFIISNDKDMTQGKQIDILWKAVNKQGRYIENLEKMVAILNKDNEYKELFNKRLELVEAFINNIELIDKGDIN